MRKKNIGFTLIEILVALMILAVALFAVIMAMQQSVKDTTHVSNKLEAHWVAMNIMAEIQIGLLSPPTDVQCRSGKEKMLGKTFQWRAGVDQAKHSTYERIYVNVMRHKKQLAHVVGFIKK